MGEYDAGYENCINSMVNEAADMQFRIDSLRSENDKLRELCKWLLNPYRLGAVTGEGVDKHWCRETFNRGSCLLCELVGEVDE